MSERDRSAELFRLLMGEVDHPHSPNIIAPPPPPPQHTNNLLNLFNSSSQTPRSDVPVPRNPTDQRRLDSPSTVQLTDHTANQTPAQRQGQAPFFQSSASPFDLIFNAPSAPTPPQPLPSQQSNSPSPQSNYAVPSSTSHVHNLGLNTALSLSPPSNPSGPSASSALLQILSGAGNARTPSLSSTSQSNGLFPSASPSAVSPANLAPNESTTNGHETSGRNEDGKSGSLERVTSESLLGGILGIGGGAGGKDVKGDEVKGLAVPVVPPRTGGLDQDVAVEEEKEISVDAEGSSHAAPPNVPDDNPASSQFPESQLPISPVPNSGPASTSFDPDSHSLPGKPHLDGEVVDRGNEAGLGQESEWEDVVDGEGQTGGDVGTASEGRTDGHSRALSLQDGKSGPNNETDLPTLQSPQSTVTEIHPRLKQAAMAPKKKKFLASSSESEETPQLLDEFGTTISSKKVSKKEKKGKGKDKDEEKEKDFEAHLIQAGSVTACEVLEAPAVDLETAPTLEDISSGEAGYEEEERKDESIEVEDERAGTSEAQRENVAEEKAFEGGVDTDPWSSAWGSAAGGGANAEVSPDPTLIVQAVLAPSAMPEPAQEPAAPPADETSSPLFGVDDTFPPPEIPVSETAPGMFGPLSPTPGATPESTSMTESKPKSATKSVAWGSTPIPSKPGGSSSNSPWAFTTPTKGKERESTQSPPTPGDHLIHGDYTPKVLPDGSFAVGKEGEFVPRSSRALSASKRAADGDDKRQLSRDYLAKDLRKKLVSDAGGRTQRDGIMIAPSDDPYQVHTFSFDVGNPDPYLLFTEDVSITPITILSTPSHFSIGKRLSVDRIISYATKNQRVRLIDRKTGSRILLKSPLSEGGSGETPKVVDLALFKGPWKSQSQAARTWTRIAICDDSGRVTIFQVPSSYNDETSQHELVATVTGPSMNPPWKQCLAFRWNPVDMDRFVILTDVHEITFYKLVSTGQGTEIMVEKENHISTASTIVDFRFSPDGMTFVYALADGTVHVRTQANSQVDLVLVESQLHGLTPRDILTYVEFISSTDGEVVGLILGTRSNTDFLVYHFVRDAEPSRRTKLFGRMSFTPPSGVHSAGDDSDLFGSAEYQQSLQVFAVSNTLRGSIFAFQFVVESIPDRKLPSDRVSQLAKVLSSADESQAPRRVRLSHAVEIPSPDPLLTIDLDLEPRKRKLSVFVQSPAGINELHIDQDAIAPDVDTSFPDMPAAEPIQEPDQTAAPQEQPISERVGEEAKEQVTPEETAVTESEEPGTKDEQPYEVPKPQSDEDIPTGAITTTEEARTVLEKSVDEEATPHKVEEISHHPSQSLTETETEEKDAGKKGKKGKKVKVDKKAKESTRLAFDAPEASNAGEAVIPPDSDTAAPVDLSGASVATTALPHPWAKPVSLTSDLGISAVPVPVSSTDRDAHDVPPIKQTLDREVHAVSPPKNTSERGVAAKQKEVLPETVVGELSRLEGSLRTNLGKLFSAEMLKQQKKLEADRVTHQAEEAERQEKVLRLVSETLTKNTAKTLEANIKNEFKNIVIPLLSHLDGDAVKSEIKTGLVHAIRTSLPNELATVVQRPDVAAHLSREISSTFAPIIANDVRSTIPSLVDLISSSLEPIKVQLREEMHRVQVEARATVDTKDQEIQELRSVVGDLRIQVAGLTAAMKEFRETQTQASQTVREAATMALTRASGQGSSSLGPSMSFPQAQAPGQPVRHQQLPSGPWQSLAGPAPAVFHTSTKNPSFHVGASDHQRRPSQVHSPLRPEQSSQNGISPISAHSERPSRNEVAGEHKSSNYSLPGVGGMPAAPNTFHQNGTPPRPLTPPSSYEDSFLSALAPEASPTALSGLIDKAPAHRMRAVFHQKGIGPGGRDIDHPAISQAVVLALANALAHDLARERIISVDERLNRLAWLEQAVGAFDQKDPATSLYIPRVCQTILVNIRKRLAMPVNANGITAQKEELWVEAATDFLRKVEDKQARTMANQPSSSK